MDAMGVSCVLFLSFVKGQEQCSGELWCEQGHCCGSDGTHCCTYYYELWWFWMIWGLIIMLSCCCLYQQHRMKKRQRHALRALQTYVNDPAFAGIPVSWPESVSSGSVHNSTTDQEFRLPSYDEVQYLPKDPPSYDVLYESGESGNISDLRTTPADEHSVINRTSIVPTFTLVIPDHINDSDDTGLLDNEALPSEDPPPAYAIAAVQSQQSVQ